VLLLMASVLLVISAVVGTISEFKFRIKMPSYYWWMGSLFGIVVGILIGTWAQQVG